MKRTTRIAAASGALTVLAAFFWMAFRPPAQAVSVAAPSAASTSLAVPEVDRESPPLDPQREPVQQISSAVTTGRQKLEEFWGPLKPDALERLSAAGVDLDAPFHCPPWEEVEEHFRTQLATVSEADDKARYETEVQWPETLTMESLAKHLPVAVERAGTLTDLNLAEIDLLTAEDNHRIRELARQYCDSFKVGLASEWSRGNYGKSPLSSRVIPRSERRAIYSGATAFNGWAAKIHLFADDYPEIAGLQEELRALRGQRDRKVFDYVRTLK
jgi:hypothetical protein